MQIHYLLMSIEYKHLAWKKAEQTSHHHFEVDYNDKLCNSIYKKNENLIQPNEVTPCGDMHTYKCMCIYVFFPLAALI